MKFEIPTVSHLVRKRRKGEEGGDTTRGGMEGEEGGEGTPLGMGWKGEEGGEGTALDEGWKGEVLTFHKFPGLCAFKEKG